MKRHECSRCGNLNCFGSCDNYLLFLSEHLHKNDLHVDRFMLEQIFAEIPKFHYALEMKINAIFGTDLEVASKSQVDEEKTKEFNIFLYTTNANGSTNINEIKKALKDKEIFGESYLFYDNDNLYYVPKEKMVSYGLKNKDPIINKTLYYTVGEVSLPDELIFPSTGFIKQSEGYIISPENVVKLTSDSYVLNSDLKQLQVLLEINRKICDSTTKKDFGDIFLLTDDIDRKVLSVVAERIKNTAEEAIKKMRERIANLIKQNKTDDTNVVVLDKNYKDVKQVQPVTLLTDYEFVYENQDDIIASAMNFPTILLGLGEASGNISKEALIKDAKSTILTSLKNDTANALSMIAQKKFGNGFYLRFKEFKNVEV